MLKGKSSCSPIPLTIDSRTQSQFRCTFSVEVIITDVPDF